MTQHLCVCCPQLRQGDPRTYDRAHVCEGCRSRLRSLLVEVVELYGDVDLEKGSNGASKVSGSRTPPLPLVASALDMTLPARLRSVSDGLVPQFERVYLDVWVWEPARPTDAEEYPMVKEAMSHRRPSGALGPSGDQVGDPSVASVLESWARDWQTYAWALLPEPNVGALAGWLKDRLEWACDEHPAVDDFAAEIDLLCRRLRPHGPRAELKLGVPCRECERLTLYRWPGSDFIECGSCPVLMTMEEYSRWTSLISSPEHQPWVREIVNAKRGEGT